MLSFYEHHKDGTILHLKISPNSAKNAVTGIFEEGFFSSLKISISAIPEKGKANKELIKYLSSVFDIPKNSLELLKGESAHKKLVLIRDKSSYIEKKLQEIELSLK